MHAYRPYRPYTPGSHTSIMVTHPAGGYSLYCAERLLTGLYVAAVGLSAMMVIWILFAPAVMLAGYEWHDTLFLNNYKHDGTFPGPVHISEIVREFLQFERSSMM